MTKEDWGHLKHFSPNENWGDPLKMDFSLLWVLDSFRAYIDRKIVVVCGTQGNHVKDSQHYLGKAVDVVVETNGLAKLDVLFSVFRFPFTGIGLYPKSKCAGMVSPLGFHFDSRDVRSLPRGITQATWMGVPNEKGKNNYYDLNFANLKTFGVIE